MMSIMKPPKTLFKYEAINTYSLRNLKNASLYFNKPSSFNDPFDCSIMLDSVNYSDEDLVRLFNNMIDAGEIYGFPRASSLGDLPNDFSQQVANGLRKAVLDKQNFCLNNIGCTCFSETNIHLLLWSHYANGHRGICLEFDTSSPLFEKIFNVTYSDDYPKFNPIEVILNKERFSSDRSLFAPLLAKFTCWEYEREWRAFHQEPNKLYTYPVEALKAVYFGISAETTDIEIVCLILLGQSKNIEFYRGKKGNTSFEVDFEKFTYTPHIDTI